MKPKTIEAIKAHALLEYPKEACGLIIVFKGREKYITCENRAENKEQHCVVSAEDFANAEDKGEVVAFVHSHPNANAMPSDADRVLCEGSQLTWVIVSVTKDVADGIPVISGINQIQPEGYLAPLVGRSFTHGVLDCYSLVRDYYKQELSIDLPDFERKDGWWNDGKSNLYLDNFQKAGGVKLAADALLKKGDIILMEVQTANGVPEHAAVYLGEGGLMLHHLYGRLSSRDVYGGYWKDITRAVVRHKDFL